MDQRRGAAQGRGGPADLPAADALDPTPPGDSSGARGSPGPGGGTRPSARPLRRPRAPPRQLTPRTPSHSPSSPRQQQGRGGGSRQALSLLSVLLTEAGYSDQTRRRHGARAYEGTGERAHASGPNTAAHVTRCPPLLRNRWPGYAPPSRISGLRAGVWGGVVFPTFWRLGDRVPLTSQLGSNEGGSGSSSSEREEEAEIGLASATEERAKDDAGQVAMLNSPTGGAAWRPAHFEVVALIWK